VSEAAAGILLNALLTNALWRDVWPDVPNPEENVAGFVELVLKGVGLIGQAAEKPALAVVPPARAGARGKR
jgi:hypothetical protein